MNPGELIVSARALADDMNRKLGASRYLGSALLVRQALEDTLDAYWRRSVPGLEDTSGRAQLVTLPFYLHPDLAGRVAYAWNRLSAWCHHDAYELPPHRDELASVINTVEELLIACSVR